MVFGLVDPKKALEAFGDAAYPIDSLNVCPICGAATRFDGARYPLGRVRFPHIQDDTITMRVALGCVNCYVKQTRCNTYSIEELRTLRLMKGKRGRPVKAKSDVLEVDESTELELLKELKQIVTKLIALKSFSATCDAPVTHDADFIDSLIGEHQSEVDQDAKDAALRATLTPEEWWNGKTTREILDIHAERIGMMYDADEGRFVPYDI